MPTGQQQLEALLAGRNLWGRAGRQLYVPMGGRGDPGTLTDGSMRGNFLWNDPRYFEQFTTPGSEGGGGETDWRLNAGTDARFNRNGTRWTQLNTTSTGGTNEVMDPARVQWDDEFGAMTPWWNIRPDRRAETQDLALFAAVSLGLGGAIAPAIAAGNAASGVPAWASTAMRTAPSLGRMALNADGSPATGSGRTGSSSMPNGLDRGTGAFDQEGVTPSLYGRGVQPATAWDQLLGLLGGGGLGSMLGVLGIGHQGFGNGIGTANGAMEAGTRASALADPWGTSGRRQQFNDMMTPERVMSMLSQDPSAVRNNPAYQFDLQEGTNAINVGDAAQGTLRSGNRLYELQNYGQGLASRYGQQMFNNNLQSLGVMGNLAGVGASSPTASAEAIWQGSRNAGNIRNGAMGAGFGGGSMNPLNGAAGLLGLLGRGGSALWNWLTGSGFDPTNTDFTLGPDPDFSGFDYSGDIGLEGAF
jgi:hypothetical protein